MAAAKWTRESVEARLIAAFRALPHCPVFTQGRAISAVLTDREGSAVADVLNWATLLSDDSAGRTFLWSWARCRARRDSFGAMCREMGWARATAEDGRRRAAETIVRQLAGARQVS